jgi:hypothetical protein
MVHAMNLGNRHLARPIADHEIADLDKSGAVAVSS